MIRPGRVKGPWVGSSPFFLRPQGAYIDENFDPRVELGASAPDSISLDGTGIKISAFDGAGTLEESSAHKELNHDYKEGTDLYFHLHCRPTTAAAGDIRWFMEVYITEANGPTVRFNNTLSVVVATRLVAWDTIIVSVGTVAGANLKIGDQVDLRLFRDPTDPLDTYGADAAVSTFGYHYLVNSLGSRELGAK